MGQTSEDSHMSDIQLNKLTHAIQRAKKKGQDRDHLGKYLM